MRVVNPPSVAVFYVFVCAIHYVSLHEANMFASSQKMMELAKAEVDLIKAVGSSSDSQHQDLISFVRRRETETKERKMLTNSTLHPNSIFLLIQAFLDHWQTEMKAKSELNQILHKHRVALPTQTDLAGVIAGILRLQKVYNIPAENAFVGNYSGYLGPPLSLRSAHAIGAQAFSDGILDQSVHWLQLALNEDNQRDGMRAQQERAREPETQSAEWKSSVTALLGRAYVYSNDLEQGQEYLQRAVDINPAGGDELTALEQDLRHAKQKKYEVWSKETISEEMRRMCTRPKHQVVEKLLPFHRCRYKRSLWLPYLTYKEEILSEIPAASILYDVITDQECRSLIGLAKDNMKAAKTEITQGGGGSEGQLTYDRASNIYWARNNEDPKVERLSKRIQDITWLNVENRNLEGPHSSEPFQVLNYGIGGHYNEHVDNLMGDLPFYLQNAGTRIATFLLYLSDVAIGGHTVFPLAGISVPPVKGAALLWYNVKTDQSWEPLTRHAGCPVLNGHKWAANKWIWTYGNVYRTPCGSVQSSSRFDVEDVVFSRRNNIEK